jgi:hypothetical protein
MIDIKTIQRALQQASRDMEADGVYVDDSIAYDLVQSVLYDTHGLKEQLEAQGISDAEGYLIQFV